MNIKLLLRDRLKLMNKVIKLGCVYSNPKNIGGNGRGQFMILMGLHLLL